MAFVVFTAEIIPRGLKNPQPQGMDTSRHNFSIYAIFPGVALGEKKKFSPSSTGFSTPLNGKTRIFYPRFPGFTETARKKFVKFTQEDLCSPRRRAGIQQHSFRVQKRRIFFAKSLDISAQACYHEIDTVLSKICITR